MNKTISLDGMLVGAARISEEPIRMGQQNSRRCKASRRCEAEHCNVFTYVSVDSSLLKTPQCSLESKTIFDGMTEGFIKQT